MSEEVTPLASHQFRLQGRLVTMRTAFPMPENKDLIGLMNTTNVNDLSTLPKFLARTIEAMDGVEAPADPASYAELDALLLWPLFKKVDQCIYDQMYNAPKN